MDILRTFLDNGNFKLVGQEGIFVVFACDASSSLVASYKQPD